MVMVKAVIYVTAITLYKVIRLAFITDDVMTYEYQLQKNIIRKMYQVKSLCYTQKSRVM